MKSSVIAIDFDDVLMAFNDGFVRFHNEKFGTAIKYEDIVTYDMEKVYGCDTSIIVERVIQFYGSEAHATAMPIDGAQEAIEYLCNHYWLEIVTSRAQVLEEQTRQWTERLFPNSFRSLHFTNGFGAAEGMQKVCKSEVCTHIGAAVLIDDALSHAAVVARNGIPVLLPDRPWNKGEVPQGVTRVRDWKEVVSWVDTHV